MLDHHVSSRFIKNVGILNTNVEAIWQDSVSAATKMIRLTVDSARIYAPVLYVYTYIHVNAWNSDAGTYFAHAFQHEKMAKYNYKDTFK